MRRSPCSPSPPAPCRALCDDERDRACRGHQGGICTLLGAVIAAILAVMLVTLMLLLVAQEVHHVIGVTARKVIVRVFGVLLAALAVQSIFNGLAEARLFG